ncbi:hypothetical protein [Streptomyces sp. NBC_00005]|uniref:hypothetical protein n=1 Tax=Streptomyces sp. NBC_00005 TaxID=2903609 RepID=UPI003243247B
MPSWQNALQLDGILVEIRLLSAATDDLGYQRFGRRRQDSALVGVAVCQGDLPRVALMNVAERTIRATAVEQALTAGQSPAEAAEHADLGLIPTDTQADAAYRAHLARRLTERALQHALSISWGVPARGGLVARLRRRLLRSGRQECGYRPRPGRHPAGEPSQATPCRVAAGPVKECR